MLAWAMAWLVACAGVVAGDDQQGEPAAGGPPDTNQLCVSKCGTCPTVCSTPPPAPPSSSDAGDSTAPPTPKSGGGGGGSSSPPSNYYYFFTAAGSRSSCAGASAYALVFLVLVSVAAVLQ